MHLCIHTHIHTSLSIYTIDLNTQTQIKRFNTPLKADPPPPRKANRCHRPSHSREKARPKQRTEPNPFIPLRTQALAQRTRRTRRATPGPTLAPALAPLTEDRPRSLSRQEPTGRPSDRRLDARGETRRRGRKARRKS